MKFQGLSRVKIVYSIWAIIYLALFAIMIFLKLKIPLVLLIINLIFSLKTIVYDYRLISLKRKRVYWLEHGPFLFWIFLIWSLSIKSTYFKGYVNLLTAMIALIGFSLDLWKDLKEDPKVYKN